MKSEKSLPPQSFLRFFRWYCHPKLADHIEGDLLEEYNVRIKTLGKTHADIRFIVDVLLLLRPSIIRPPEGYQNLNNYGMYKSYIKIGWRNLLRSKGYSFINIGGLAMGMTVAIFIGLWTYDELSFNKYHQNYESIAQIWGGGTDPETSTIDGNTAMQYPAAAILKNNYQHYFKHVLVGWWFNDYTLSVENNKFIRKGEFIDEGALDMLSSKMLKGTYESLNDPHSIVLSESTAEAIFGNDDPINKTLKIDNRIEVQVTGVYEDIPRNNHFSKIQFFSPWALWVLSNDWIKRTETNWDNRSFNIYVQLQPNTTMETANAAIHDFYYKNVPKDYLKDIEKNKSFAQVIPMSTWHLYSEFENGKPAKGRITVVWLFIIIGIFVLVLACINFVNLGTARSERRAKETGIRKTIGSVRSQLVAQFLSESFLVVILAFACSTMLVTVFLPWFNELADKNISIPYTNVKYWTIIILFITATGFMAGIYPAFYLSSFQPAKVLKGTMRLGRLAALPRKVLVVVQFTVSVVLILGTIVVYEQIQYAQNRPIGYNRASLISLIMSDRNFQGKHEIVRNELLNTGMVEEIAFSNSTLTHAWNNAGGFDWKGKESNTESDFTVCNGSDSYGKTVKWEIVKGRDFDRNLASDSSSIIVNESAVKYMKLESPIGEYVTHESGFKQKIIGVVKDLIMGSPYEPVKQSIFLWNKYEYTNILVRLKPTSIASEAIPIIKKVFEQIIPTAAFDYKFADQEYANKFSQEERIGKLSRVFAMLAIFISCLGLFGLASFVAEQRTKEIGIRKVLGASTSNLWQLLSKDFVVLVIISCFIAVPIAYHFMNIWLYKYQYRTEISWWIFLVTSIGALALTLLTVSFQAIKAALMNPVNSLKSE